MDNNENNQTEDLIELTSEKNTNCIALEKPIVRGNTTINEVKVLRPKDSVPFIGVSISELIQMDVNALQKVLPRVTEPKLTNHEVKTLDPADTFSLGAQVAAFFLKKKDLESLSPTE